MSASREGCRSSAMEGESDIPPTRSNYLSWRPWWCGDVVLMLVSMRGTALYVVPPLSKILENKHFRFVAILFNPYILEEIVIEN